MFSPVLTRLVPHHRGRRCANSYVRLAALAALLVFAIDAMAGDQPADDDFVDLLNEQHASQNEDIQGWTLRANELLGQQTATEPGEGRWCLGSPRTTHRNFELRLRFRVVRGQCQLQYRGDAEDQQQGYRVTLSNDPKRAGLLTDSNTNASGDSMVLARPGQKVVLDIDGNRRNSPVAAGTIASTDQPTWHELVVVAMANHLTHKIDGNIVVECVDQRFHQRSMAGSFFLELRDAAHVELKEIRVRPVHGMFAPYEGDDADALLAPAATAGGDITVPAGFVAERLYSVPREREGSWVAMTFESTGKLIVAAHDGGLYRVTLPTTTSTAATEKLTVPVAAAQGLLAVDEFLYVVVNGNQGDGPGLYRLADHDRDGRYEETKQLKKFVGSGDHGPHGVVLSRDRMSLFVIAGNDTKLPDDIGRLLVPPLWQEDQLLPRMEDPTGFASWNMAPNGWICRTDRDGKEWELVAVGLRNAYDLAVDSSDNLFTFDADMEFDTGLPWYRPARINHVPSGAEFGYRHGSGKWPDHFPDSVSATLDVGLASPTGLIFGHETTFPQPYRTALFALDWAFGTIYAVHLRPHGSVFTGSFERFATAKPLPVTDVCVGPDGALYFITGGRGTQSGLYRIRYVGPLQTSVTTEATDAKSPNPWSRLRRRLEAYHANAESPPALIDDIWPHLGSSDVGVRYAARIAIEHQPARLWRERALVETNSTVAIQALIGLSRTMGGEERDQLSNAGLGSLIIQRLNTLPLHEYSEPTLLAALRAYDLAMIRGGTVPTDVKAVAANKLVAIYPHPSDLVNRELCKLLSALDDPRVVAKSLRLMEQAATQQQQISLAISLRVVSSGWTDDTRDRYFAWFDRAISQYAGSPTFRDYLLTARTAALVNVPVARRDSYSRRTPSSSEDELQLPVARNHVYNWQLVDILPLLDQLRSGRSFASGKQAFVAARCAECHRFHVTGGNTGPDLTSVAARFSSRDLAEAILEPSRVIADLYRETTFETVDGRLISGRLVGEAEGTLKIQTGLGGETKLVEIATRDVEERFASNVSSMPGNLLSVLTKEEVLDLLAYLLSGGNGTSP